MQSFLRENEKSSFTISRSIAKSEESPECQASRLLTRDLCFPRICFSVQARLRQLDAPDQHSRPHQQCDHQCASRCGRQDLSAPVVEFKPHPVSRRSVKPAAMPPTPPDSSSALGASFGVQINLQAQPTPILEASLCPKTLPSPKNCQQRRSSV